MVKPNQATAKRSRSRLLVTITADQFRAKSCARFARKWLASNRRRRRNHKSEEHTMTITKEVDGSRRDGSAMKIQSQMMART